MKKVLFIAAVAVASLASCKKDRVCTCTSTTTSTGGGTTIVTSDASQVTYTKAKKGDARSACLSYTTTNTSTYGTSTTTADCSIK